MKKEYIIIVILLFIIGLMFYLNKDNKTPKECDEIISNYKLEMKKEIISNKIKIVDSMNIIYNHKIDSINKKIIIKNEKYNNNKKVIDRIGGLPKF